MARIRLGGPSKQQPVSSGSVSPRGKTSGSFTKGQFCPYLSALDRDLPYNHPSSQNVCRGQTSRKRRGFRKFSVGYGKVTRQTQLEICNSKYLECEHFQRKRKEPQQEEPQITESDRQQQYKDSVASKIKKRTERRRRKRRHNLDSAKWHTAKQLGAISAVTIVIAFIVSFVIAGGPGKFIESLTFMYIQNQAKELGLSKEDLEKVRASGILKGGGMGRMKNLSRSQKEKLKKSSLFKGMSASKKAELKKKFGKR